MFCNVTCNPVYTCRYSLLRTEFPLFWIIKKVSIYQETIKCELNFILFKLIYLVL